jgi:hypothetical protein
MKKRIVIAGGGFAGLYAAKHLDKTIARHADVEVVLISDENFTLFTPLLHEVAAGDLYPGDIINPLRRILRHVMVVEAEAETIDLNTRTISCRAVVQIHPRNQTSSHSSCYNRPSRRSLPLLPSYWGSACASAQSREPRNCMKDRVFDSGCSLVTFGNWAQQC